MLTVTEGDLPALPARSRRDSGTPPAARTARNAHSAGVLDHALIKAIASGDRDAMALLYARHSVRVYRFSLRITGSPALADDIVSEVFLDVWRRADGFKANAQVSTWLLAIARNKSFSALRRRVDEPLEGDEAASVEDPTPDPEVLVHDRDRSEIIGKCLSQLSAAHRQVIELVYYHEKSVDEVARIVGAPTSTVRIRLFYARHRIKALLNAAGFGGLGGLVVA
jgi:RNA polymerase sigma-70 factor (ECF subfamily)